LNKYPLQEVRVKFQDEYLTVKALAVLTVESESIWRKRIGRNELPSARFGVNIRVKRSDAEKWIAAHSTAAADSVTTTAEAVLQ
jgi:hypothetical protein